MNWGWEGKPSKAFILEKHGQGNLFMPLFLDWRAT